MEWKDIEPKTREVRNNLTVVISKMLQEENPLQHKDGNDLNNLLAILSDDIEDIVVCGEVKKGKSSFINAMIGENLLPTDTEVSTSQIFRILHADEQRFHLVFTNGERQEISREELSQYGSQKFADDGLSSASDTRSLDYIEIKTPVEFLPQNVSIVDTPGIGALYAAHENITMRYLQHASAVVFIMDPANPLTQQELAFVEKVFKVTKQVMFVMTKMDNYSPEYIETMVSRNEELLAPYAELTESKQIKVTPMSSKLLQAAVNDEETLRPLTIEESGFHAVKNELMTMIQRTVGLARSYYVLTSCEQYLQEVMSSIVNQSMATSSSKSPEVLKERIDQLKADFVKNWGSVGEKRGEIMQYVTDRVTSLEVMTNKLTSHTGEVYTKFKDEIDRLTRQEVKGYVATIGRRLQDEYGRQWKRLLDECLNGMEAKLSQYGADMENGRMIAEQSVVRQETKSFETPTMEFQDYFNQFRSGYLTASLSIAVISLAFPVAGWATLLAAAVLSIPFVSEAEKKKIQNELLRYLGETNTLMYQSLCINPISEDEPYSVLTKAKRQIVEATNNAIDKIYKSQQNRLAEELDALVKQPTTDGAERMDKMQKLNQLRMGWLDIKKSLIQVRQQLEQIHTDVKS